MRRSTRTPAHDQSLELTAKRATSSSRGKSVLDNRSHRTRRCSRPGAVCWLGGRAACRFAICTRHVVASFGRPSAERRARWTDQFCRSGSAHFFLPLRSQSWARSSPPHAITSHFTREVESRAVARDTSPQAVSSAGGRANRTLRSLVKPRTPSASHQMENTL
jgi:hypothetical protein